MVNKSAETAVVIIRLLWLTSWLIQLNQAWWIGAEKPLKWEKQGPQVQDYVQDWEFGDIKTLQVHKSLSEVERRILTSFQFYVEKCSF